MGAPPKTIRLTPNPEEASGTRGIIRARAATPGSTLGETEFFDRFGPQLGGRRRCGRRDVPPARHPGRVGEVLVQVVDPFDLSSCHGRGHRGEVEHRQVLDHLAQAHAAGVRAHGHAELGRQQQIGDVLVDPGHPARVDLHDVDGPRLQQLLEDHPVGGVLAGGHLHRLHRPADLGGAEDVVRAGGLLDPFRAGTEPARVSSRWRRSHPRPDWRPGRSRCRYPPWRARSRGAACHPRGGRRLLA